jgi:hypothetical protein
LLLLQDLWTVYLADNELELKDCPVQDLFKPLFKKSRGVVQEELEDEEA